MRLFVVADTQTPFLKSSPSVQASNWLGVCSASSSLLICIRITSPPRDFPNASNSSMKTTEWAILDALSTVFLTLTASFPTTIFHNISSRTIQEWYSCCCSSTGPVKYSLFSSPTRSLNLPCQYKIPVVASSTAAEQIYSSKEIIYLWRISRLRIQMLKIRISWEWSRFFKYFAGVQGFRQNFGRREGPYNHGLTKRLS